MFIPLQSGPLSKSFATLLSYPVYAQSLPLPTSQTLPLPKTSRRSLLFPLSNQYTRRFCDYVSKSNPSSPVRQKKYASTSGGSLRRASSSSRLGPLTETPISGTPVMDASHSILSGQTAFLRIRTTPTVVRSVRARQRSQRPHGGRHMTTHRSTSAPE